MKTTFSQIIDSDFSHLEGTSCYCSDESAEAIRHELAGRPVHAVHIIGTGDYHYISLFRAETLDEPFTLVLFDNHPDDQQTAFGGALLSCGSWVEEVRRLPLCQGMVWYNGRDEVQLPQSGSVFISIDIDVLSTDYARTDWDQGNVSLDGLLNALDPLLENCNVLAVDICGGHTIQKGASTEDLAINAGTVEALCNKFVPII